jgi:hypothetical protein
MLVAETLAFFTAQAQALPVSGGASTSEQASLFWLPSDINTVESYILGTGSVSVSMSACPAWKMWMLGCSVTDVWNPLQGYCVSKLPINGYTFMPQSNTYISRPNTAQINTPYKGPSCPVGAYTTSVVIVGYVNSSWIVQAPYGASWGSNGYFYAQQSTAGAGNMTYGGLGFTNPVTMQFIPRWNTTAYDPGTGIPRPTNVVGPGAATNITNGFSNSTYAPTPSATPSPGSGGSNNGFVTITSPTVSISAAQTFLTFLNTEIAAYSLSNDLTAQGTSGASASSSTVRGRGLAATAASLHPLPLFLCLTCMSCPRLFRPARNPSLPEWRTR